MRFFFWMMWFNILCGSAQASTYSIGDDLGVSPLYDFKEITTDHFRIVFPKELTAQAKKSALYYEETYKVLSVELNWKPALRTNVLLLDQFDAANGMTSPVARFGMILYLTPPETWFSTNYYDDWLKLLIVHEFTHFLNMDATRDFYRILRVVFGDAILPNSLWPSWMLEGLAVYMETRHTQAGRGRSPYYEGILRTAVDAGKLKDAPYVKQDQINGPWPSAPKGETPYFFGYQLLEHIGKDSVENATRLTTEGSATLPFFINRALENATDKDWYAVWKEWLITTQDRIQLQLNKLRTVGFTPIRREKEIFTDVAGNTVSADGTLQAYTKNDENHWQALYLRDLKTDKVQLIEDKFLGVAMSFTPDNRALIYSSLQQNRIFYYQSDLKVYDLQKKKSYFLTAKLRAKDPNLSRDGKRLVFTVAQDSANHLYIANIEKKDDEYTLQNIHEVFHVDRYDRVSQPQWSPSGKEIVFSWKKNGKLGETIARWEEDNRTVSELFSSEANNRFPTYSPQGELYFVSDRTGVDNIYRWTGKNQAELRTNVVSNLILPHFSTNSIYASVYGLRGWYLSKVELSAKPLSIEDATITSKPVLAGLSGPLRNSEAFSPNSTAESAYQEHDYSPWRSLAPRQWAPILFLAKDQTYAGAQVLGYDSAFRHQYIAYGAYDSRTQKLDGYFNYLNRSYVVNLNAIAQVQSKDYISGTSSSTYVRREDLDLEASLPYRFTIARLTPAIGAEYSSQKLFRTNAAGTSQIATSRYVPSQYAKLTFSNIRNSNWAIAPERGIRALLGAKRYQDDDFENYKAILRYQQFFEIFPHHVFEPSLKATWISKINPLYGDANAVIRGRRNSILTPFYSMGFESHPIRGYSTLVLTQKQVYTAAMDYHMPLASFFRGWGTRPVFFEQLSLNLFGEMTATPIPTNAGTGSLVYLPSVGAGLRFTTEWAYNVPVVFSLDYHHGSRTAYSGGDEVFLSINLTSIPGVF